MKYCKDCEQTKPLDQFTKRRSAKDGLATYCKVCNNLRRKLWGQKNRAKRKAAQYGLTLKRVAEIRESQDEVCGMCHEAKRLYLYTTTKTIALLCVTCRNWAIKNAGIE